MKIIYFFIFILLINNVYAFGVSPSSFEINLRNNESIEKEFTLINNEFETNEFEISSYGIEFLNFTKFNLKIEPDNHEDVKFLIDVPYETLQGNYEGRIYAKKIKPEEGGVNLGTLLGIKINANVESDFKEVHLKEFAASNKVEKTENTNLKFTNPEIIAFYVLIALVLILVIWRFFV